jgi:hypothetical protein
MSDDPRYAEAIRLAIALGEQKVVIEVAQRCHNYRDAPDEEARDREEYQKRLAAFVAELDRLTGRGQ